MSSGPEHVRYLSQQFVEQLCSAQGLAVELRQEIERVIFESTEKRLNTKSFEELANLYLEPIWKVRTSTRESIKDISGKIITEDALLHKLPKLKTNQKELVSKIDKTKNDMQALMPKGNELRAKCLGEIESAVAAMNAVIEQKQRTLLKISDLSKEVIRLRQIYLPEQLQKLKSTYQESGLTSSDWTAFSLGFNGDVDAILDRAKMSLDAEIHIMTKGDSAHPIDFSTALFSKWPLEALKAERKKLNDEIGIDKEKQRRYDNLQRNLKNDEASLGRLKSEIENSSGAETRRKASTELRKSLYQDVFQSYLNERSVLSQLYEPLQAALVDGRGSLGRLRFAVTRYVDLNLWVENGEKHFDLRKESAIRLHGGLRRQAEKGLVPAWKTGTSETVAAAMLTFIGEMFEEFKKAMPATAHRIPKTDIQIIRRWIEEGAKWPDGKDGAIPVKTVKPKGA